jgi:RNA polymerase sigma factor FliA
MPPSDAPAVLELVRAELGLVDGIAKRVSRLIGRAVQQEDLVGAGREGLFDAARRFDPSRGTSFRTYARVRVEGAIVDAVRQMAGLPRRTWERLAALRAAGLLSEGRLEPRSIGLGPRDEADLEAVHVVLTERVAAFVTAATLGAEFADEQQTDGDGDARATSPSEVGYWATDPEQAVMRAELLALIRAGIQDLPPDERLVLEKVYYENQSLADAARELDFGKPWVTRLHARGIQRLSQRLKPQT